MTRQHSRQANNLRTQIAQLAAILVDEHGIRDYALAKRKAARQLGAPDRQPLPEDQEVLAAMRAHQALFMPESSAEELLAMQKQALRWMQTFRAYEPRLCGPLADGVASENADIEIEVRHHSTKAFELFLVNQRIEYHSAGPEVAPVYRLSSAPYHVTLYLRTHDKHLKRSTHHTCLSLTQLETLICKARADEPPLDGVTLPPVRS